MTVRVTRGAVYVHKSKNIKIRVTQQGLVELKTGSLAYRPARASLAQTMAHFGSSLRDYRLA